MHRGGARQTTRIWRVVEIRIVSSQRVMRGRGLFGNHHEFASMNFVEFTNGHQSRLPVELDSSMAGGRYDQRGRSADSPNVVTRRDFSIP